MTFKMTHGNSKLALRRMDLHFIFMDARYFYRLIRWNRARGPASTRNEAIHFQQARDCHLQGRKLINAINLLKETSDVCSH